MEHYIPSLTNNKYIIPYRRAIITNSSLIYVQWLSLICLFVFRYVFKNDIILEPVVTVFITVKSVQLPDDLFDSFQRQRKRSFGQWWPEWLQQWTHNNKWWFWGQWDQRSPVHDATDWQSHQVICPCSLQKGAVFRIPLSFQSPFKSTFSQTFLSHFVTVVQVWVMALCVTCVLAVTLSVFPAVTVKVKSVYGNKEWGEQTVGRTTHNCLAL